MFLNNNIIVKTRFKSCMKIENFSTNIYINIENYKYKYLKNKKIYNNNSIQFNFPKLVPYVYILYSLFYSGMVKLS